MTSGDPDPLTVDQLTSWCAAVLGAPVARVLFRGGNLSTVLGLRLGDGREVVVKARPAAVRHAGCAAVQRRLAAAGYPCPRLLAGPDQIAGQDLTVEEHRPGGTLLPLDESAPARFAAALAGLVALTPPPAHVPSVDPPPPWAAWDHDGRQLWPAPASTPVDLNATEGPRWLNDAACRVRTRLCTDPGTPVIGHVDFESQNVRWRGDRLHCVHDWDSAAARPEAAIAGLAAAVFPAVDRRPAAASVDDTERFLLAYARARDRPWHRDEWEIAWGAGLWALAYNARVQIAEGRRALTDRLARDVEQRLERAGA